MENTKVDTGDNATYMEDENTCYVCDGSKYVYRLEGLRSKDDVDISEFFKYKDDAVEMGRYHVLTGEWSDWKLFAYSTKSSYTHYDMNSCDIWLYAHDRYTDTDEAKNYLKCYWREGVPAFDHLFPVGWLYQFSNEFYAVVESTPDLITMRKFELCVPFQGMRRYKEPLNDNEFWVQMHYGALVGDYIHGAVGRFHPQPEKYPSIFLKKHPKELHYECVLKLIGFTVIESMSKWKS